MLDRWLAAEPHPPRRWLKITGRYLVLNIKTVYREAALETQQALIIDQSRRRRMAFTQLFRVSTEFYQSALRDLYKESDDSAQWIEQVLFRHLESLSSSICRAFRTEPRFLARYGTTGHPFPSPILPKHWYRQMRRTLRLVAHAQYVA